MTNSKFEQPVVFEPGICSPTIQVDTADDNDIIRVTNRVNGLSLAIVRTNSGFSIAGPDTKCHLSFKGTQEFGPNKTKLEVVDFNSYVDISTLNVGDIVQCNHGGDADGVRLRITGRKGQLTTTVITWMPNSYGVFKVGDTSWEIPNGSKSYSLYQKTCKFKPNDKIRTTDTASGIIGSIEGVVYDNGDDTLGLNITKASDKTIEGKKVPFGADTEGLFELIPVEKKPEFTPVDLSKCNSGDVIESHYPTSLGARLKLLVRDTTMHGWSTEVLFLPEKSSEWNLKVGDTIIINDGEGKQFTLVSSAAPVVSSKKISNLNALKPGDIVRMVSANIEIRVESVGAWEFIGTTTYIPPNTTTGWKIGEKWRGTNPSEYERIIFTPITSINDLKEGDIIEFSDNYFGLKGSRLKVEQKIDGCVNCTFIYSTDTTDREIGDGWTGCQWEHYRKVS